MTTMLVVLLLIWLVAGSLAYAFIRGASEEIDRQAEKDAAEATAAGVLH